MIIFDLDGTLADCEHRRHFVDPEKHSGKYVFNSPNWIDVQTGEKFVPHWKSFYEACDQDKPIEPVIRVAIQLMWDNEYQIWSGRCESVREKTIAWLNKNLFDCDACYRPWDWNAHLKMRPIGDHTPDDQLKERWLEETYEETKWGRRTPIEFVFDDRPKVVRMWRSHGIFVFNCCQHDGEF